MINLHNHSYYSWDAITKPRELVQFAVDNNQPAIALTDHGTMSGAVEFYEQCVKKDIIPIIGNEFYISQLDPTIKDSSNRQLNHLVVVAINKTGYQNLLHLTSESFRNFYYKPRISLENFKGHSDGLVCINGHIQSELSDQLFFNKEAAYSAESKNEIESYIDPDWEELFESKYQEYYKIFGDNLYVEIQAFDPNDLLQQTIAKYLRERVKKLGLKTVATGDSHYLDSSYVGAHQALNAIKTGSKVKDLSDIGYLTSGLYSPLTNETFEKSNLKAEIDGAQEILEKCEKYDILSPPRIPHFPVPNGIEKEEYLKSICRDGWRRKITKDRDKYYERFKHELKTLMDEDLSDYFLIVHDYIKFAENAGMLIGAGRGSVGGSLIAYLMDIIKVDPLEHGLIFERFYNAARRGSLPDIDTDFPASRRHEIIEYVREKYGADKVVGVATFGKLQGRNVIKDVLRVFSVCSFKQANEICENIPPKEKISDKLEEFKQETGSESIIEYTLRELPDAVKDYAVYNEDGELVGDYAKYFKIAMQLEGCIRDSSKHASAIIISDRPITEVAPLINDKSSDEMICAYDMHAFEKVGLLKCDMLALKNLDCLMTANDLIGEIEI